MITTTTTVRARYSETDQMGVVYHANYFAWFEVGRVLLLDEIGLPYRRLEEAGFALPVLEASARYLRPVRFDDEVTVATTVRERAGVRLRITYRLTVRGDDVATGETLHTFVGPAGKPVRPPAIFTDAIVRAMGTGQG